MSTALWRLPLPPDGGAGWRPPDPADVQAAHAWFAHALGQLLAGVEDAPAVGSPAWCALAPDDPRRWPGVIAAARAWWAEGIELPVRLREEIADRRAAQLQEQWDDWREEIHHLWRLMDVTDRYARAYGRTRAEQLARARAPRPGDYHGRDAAADTDCPGRTSNLPAA